MHKFLFAAFALALVLSMVGPAHADDTPKDAARTAHSDKDAKHDELPVPPEHSVVTRHNVRIGARSTNYKATAGTILIKDDKGKPTVSFFYVA